MIRTLLVEDNRTFRASLKALLYARFPDMLVAEAGDGAEALRALALVQPDIVFVDINLPGGMNGLTLTERIRRESPRVRIVVITSYDLPEYREASTRLGADHFLPKSASTAAEIVSLMESFGAAPGGVSTR